MCRTWPIPNLIVSETRLKMHTKSLSVVKSGIGSTIQENPKTVHVNEVEYP